VPRFGIRRSLCRATGPLKVSFVDERARALDDCGRFF
jgi:hypothetical protein